ncbi:MAG: zinc ribbon domain-containing protein [Pseudomonadales bacterium]|nr:zinc ribbon domain-containing protein [Pseudomonadales bacterium]
MALIDCRECGEAVSSEANSCPKCGIKTPKKISSTAKVVGISLWVGVIAFGIFVTAFIDNASNELAVYSQAETNLVDRYKTAPTPKPSWITSSSNDEMTGKFSAFASSPNTNSSNEMSFPYNNVEAWLTVNCDAKRETAYIGFNVKPNLRITTTKDGYSLLTTKIRWDGEVLDMSLRQWWGMKSLDFEDDGLAISKMISSDSAFLQLFWHDQPIAYFTFSLDGSAKAIAKMRAECLVNKLNIG